jgi:plasmid stabilization system protein ParE
MSRFVLTPAARADIEEIFSFIFLDSPAAAARVLSALRSAMRRLASNPNLGHLREDLADEPLLFWQVYSYLVIYRPQAEPLQVVRVLHASRDVRSLLKDE